MRPLAIFLNFHLICAGWIFFRADSLGYAGEIFKQLLSGPPSALTHLSGNASLHIPVFLLFAGAVGSVLANRFGDPFTLVAACRGLLVGSLPLPPVLFSSASLPRLDSHSSTFSSSRPHVSPQRTRSPGRPPLEMRRSSIQSSKFPTSLAQSTFCQIQPCRDQSRPVPIWLSTIIAARPICPGYSATLTSWMRGRGLEPTRVGSNHWRSAPPHGA
jgi:hypothetical protein